MGQNFSQTDNAPNNPLPISKAAQIPPDLIKILQKISFEIEAQYFSTLSNQRILREKIYLQAKCGTDLKSLNNIYISMMEQVILNQHREMNFLMRNAKIKVLKEFLISEKEFEKSVSEAKDDQKVNNLVERINKPKRENGNCIAVNELLEVIRFQANIVDDIETVFKNYDGAKRKTIMNTVLSDITFFKYKCEREDIECSFLKTQIAEYLVLEFQTLLSKINSVLNSL